MQIIKDTSITDMKFMSSGNDYVNSKKVILGIPMDQTSSFKSGSKSAPQKIREVSIGLEEYSVYQNKSLDDLCFYDCGNLDLNIDNVEDSLKIISDATKEIFDVNKIPLSIGGEHLISVPIIKEAFNKYGNELIVIQFDAHADLRDGYLGNKFSHASTMRRITDFLPSKNIFQIGIRSGTKEEFEFAKNRTNIYMFDVYKPLKNILKKIKNRPVYITLDIDVVDPAYANGTGTPEPGGITSKELIESMSLINKFNLVGFDIVEVSPEYDISDRTALLAAEIIREVLLF